MEKNNKKIMLFAIPNYNVVYMYPAIPYLTSYLKHNGFDVMQKELNAIAYDFFLSKEYLEKCLKKANSQENEENAYILNNVEKAKQAMRDQSIYKNFEEFSKNKEILEKAFDIVSSAKNEVLKLRRNTFEYKPKEYPGEKGRKISYKSRVGLLKTIENKEENFFYDFFKEKVIPLVVKEKPALVGMSIDDQKQLVTAFVLSAMIKEALDTKIVLGGTIITRNCDVLSKDDELNKKLFSYVDFFIHNEGEFALKELAARVTGTEKKSGFEGIPKLIYKDENGRIVENLEFDFTPIEEIPAPDYDGFDGIHWTPQPVISYLSKRGCPHACSFCDIPFGYDGYYHRIEKRLDKTFKFIGEPKKSKFLSVDRVINDIKELKAKYKTKYFSFSDEELLAHWLEDFCKRLIDEKIDIDWECYARMEPKFKEKEFVKLIRKAGCRFVQLGLESVSQKVLNYENKMTKASDYEIILKNTAEEGIMNHTFFVVGMPYDNLFESMKILAFLEKNGKYIHTLKPIIYKISKWSPNAMNPESKGLSIDKNTPDLDVNLNMKNKPIHGMSIHEARLFVKILELWVEQKHKVNPVTRTYMYAQRLFITPEMIEKFSDKIKVNGIGPYEEEYLKRFSEVLKAQLKKFAYTSKEDFINENIQREYSIFIGHHSGEDKTELKKKFDHVYESEKKKFSLLYNLEKERRKFFDEKYRELTTGKEFFSLEELIVFSQKLQEIDDRIMEKSAKIETPNALLA